MKSTVISKFKDYKIFSLVEAPRKEIFKTLFWVGLPLGIQNGIDFLYNFIKSILAGNLGANSLAAEQVVTQYTSLVQSSYLSVATVNGILTGKDITQNNSVNLKKIGALGVASSLVVPAAALLSFCVAYEPLTKLFVDPNDENFEDILYLTKWLFLISGINNLIDSARQGSAGVLRGFYDTAMPAFIMLSLLWIIGVPSSALLAFPLELGVLGLFIGRSMSVCASAPILMKRCYNSVTEPEKALENVKKGFKSNLYSMFKSASACCKGADYALIAEEEPLLHNPDGENDNVNRDVQEMSGARI